MKMSSDDWSTVVYDEIINTILDNSYVFVRTNSTVQSGDKLTLWYLDGAGVRSGGISLWFPDDAVKYKLVECSYYRVFPNELPSVREKEWMIQKLGYRTLIYCNGQKVVNTTTSEDSCRMPMFRDSWSTTWKREVKNIQFPGARNTASENFFMKISMWLSLTTWSKFLTLEPFQGRQDIHERGQL